MCHGLYGIPAGMSRRVCDRALAKELEIQLFVSVVPV